MRIATAGNVVVPAALALKARGFRLSRLDERAWSATRGELELVAEDAVLLLGLAALVETRGEAWAASDEEIDDFVRAEGGGEGNEDAGARVVHSVLLRRPGEVEVTYEYRRHLGPRFARAGVRLRFSSSHRFLYSSVAVWPARDQYDDVVRDGITDSLMTGRGTTDGVRVELLGITWDDVESSADAFRRAARAATDSVLYVV